MGGKHRGYEPCRSALHSSPAYLALLVLSSRVFSFLVLILLQFQGKSFHEILLETIIRAAPTPYGITMVSR